MQVKSACHDKKKEQPIDKKIKIKNLQLKIFLFVEMLIVGICFGAAFSV